MSFNSSPFYFQVNSITRIMFLVSAALLPLIVVKTYWYGKVVILQCFIAVLASLIFEGIMLKIRNKPVFLLLADGSAVLTALLIALSLPVGIQWWINLTAVFFAIVVAKHLYGGLGQNPFNPAMVAFAVCIISFPAQMAKVPSPENFMKQQHFNHSFAYRYFQGDNENLDAISSATPLDNFKTQSKLIASKIDQSNVKMNLSQATDVQSRAWWWIFFATLFGGIFLLIKKIITWQIPFAFLASLSLISLIFWLYDPNKFANPLFHLLYGGAILGAFFIATDPVTSCRVSKAQLIYGAGCGVLAYLIRNFAAYPDGVAFAILLMNITVTSIDTACKPAIFGMKNK